MRSVKLTLLAVVLSVPSWGAYTRIVAPAAIGASTGTVTTGATCGGGASACNTTGANLFAMFIATSGTDAGSASVHTDSLGNTYTACGASSVNAGNSSGQWWISYNPTTSTATTWSAASSSGSSFVTVFALAYSGAASSPCDQTNNNISASGGGGSTLAIGIVTPSQNNELLLAGESDYNGNADMYAITAGLGIVTKYINGSFQGGAIAELIQTTAGAVSATWTVGGTPAAANIITLKAPSSGTNSLTPAHSGTF